MQYKSTVVCWWKNTKPLNYPYWPWGKLASVSRAVQPCCFSNTIVHRILTPFPKVRAAPWCCWLVLLQLASKYLARHGGATLCLLAAEVYDVLCYNIHPTIALSLHRNNCSHFMLTSTLPCKIEDAAKISLICERVAFT